MEKLVNCSLCNHEIAKSAKKCPHCGKKQGNFFKRHKVLTVILALIIIFLIIPTGESDSVDTSVPIADYKDQCIEVLYEDIARDPEAYKEQKVKFTGEIIQIMESGSKVTLRINVTKDDYDIYTDTIYVNYNYSENEKKLLEDDIVNLWGEAKGIKTYKSTIGTSISIPQVNAHSIELVPKK